MLNTISGETKFDEKEFFQNFRKELEEIQKEIESEQQETKPFTVFYSDEIIYDEFTEVLESLEGKSVLVEVVKGFCTSQYYEEFQWFEYKGNTDKVTLSFQDENDDEKFPMHFNVSDIDVIISGSHIYTDSWLIRLKNGSELMLELQW